MSTNGGTSNYPEKNDTGTDITVPSEHQSRPTNNSVTVAKETTTATVKREAMSPKGSTPPAYPVPTAENVMMTRANESESVDAQSLTDKLTLARVRQQFFLPQALTASIYNQHLRTQAGKNSAWSPFISQMVNGLPGFGIPPAYGFPQPSHAHINDQHFDKHESMTAQGSRATETACVTDESSAGTAVSKRKHYRVTGFSATGEPLDLTQSRDRVNMHLEGKMDMDYEARNGMNENIHLNEIKDVQHKVKKEVFEDKGDVLQQQQIQRQQELDGHGGQTRNAMPNIFPNTPNALALFSHMLNFPAVLNPSAPFLPHGYPYIPTALPQVSQHHPIPNLDHTVGLSQWVNMVRAVDSLRYANKPDSKSDRKRKASESSLAESREISEPNSAMKNLSTQADETLSKRARVNDNNEGLQRSVSDDPGKRRQNNPEVLKTKLRRRNSAPSAGGIVNSGEEVNKKSSVDLQSYAGCLPPQCLHILQDSGNLSITNSNSRDGAHRSLESNEEHARKGTLSSQRGIDVIVNAQRNHERRVTSPSSLHKINHNHTGNELIGSKSAHEGKESNTGKINITAPIPINPKTGYFSETSRNERIGSYLHQQRRPTAVLPFVRNSKNHAPERNRRPYETESDDDDEHIQKLQISDASSDEDDDINAAQYDMITKYRKLPQNQPSKFMESIGFGRGPWSALDNGSLLAFGSTSLSLSSSENSVLGKNVPNIPTKMACTVTKSFPRAHNGFNRINPGVNFFNTTKNSKRLRKKLKLQEFLPHSESTGPKDDCSTDLLRIQTASSILSGKHKCKGCQSVRSKDQERKLIEDIFQKSFRSSNPNGYHSTSPRSTSRLVFSSEVGRLPEEIVGLKEKKDCNAVAQYESKLSKATISVGELRHTEIPQTSAPEYSHKLFSFARTPSTKKGDNYKTKSVRLGNSQGSTEKSVISSTANEEVSRLFSNNSALPPSSVAARARGAVSSRLSSLDAKLEELRQKATERQEQKTEGSEFNSGNRKMQAESVHFAERPSPTPLNALDSRYRSNGSPFYDGDAGRFGKRNIAVIKPNQSVLDGRLPERKTPGSTCPPKKRHMKRYSPEFYNKPKVDSSIHDREVRSASPRSPFVSTNVMINNDEHSVNVRWCSPDSSPNRRKQHGSKSRTILTYRLPLGQALRGTNSHTVTLERNYRKYPRCVTSPRTDAVIVVESREVDERDQRLEIEDLEISDDEGQAQ